GGRGGGVVTAVVGETHRQGEGGRDGLGGCRGAGSLTAVEDGHRVDRVPQGRGRPHDGGIQLGGRPGAVGLGDEQGVTGDDDVVDVRVRPDLPIVLEAF